MQLNKDYEYEINLKNMFFYVLYRWRSILIVALIATALLGGYKYFSLRNVTNLSDQTQQEQAYEEDLQAKKNAVQRWSDQINSLETYRNESVYFQSNPQAIWMASCKYLVKTDPTKDQISQGFNQDPVDSILAAYSMLFSDITDDELTNVFEVVDAKYGYELIDVITNPSENTFTIQVKGHTEEYVQKGLAFIKNKIDSVMAKAQRIDKHTLLIIGEETVLTSDKDLMESQQAINIIISQKKSDLYSARLELNEVEVHGTPQNARNQIIKFAMIGFIAGVSLMILLYIICYIFKGKMMDSTEISDQYNLPLLGEIRKSGSLHNNRGLDRLISKWELGKKAMDTDTVYNNISVLIRQKEGINSIFLTSSLSTNELKPIKEALSLRLQDKKIEAKGDLLTNSEAVTETSNIDGVILVEGKNKTCRKDICRMADILSISNANMLGAIVL